MYNLVFVICLLAVTCNSSKNKSTSVTPDSLLVKVENKKSPSPPTNTPPKGEDKEKIEAIIELPSCIQKLIKQFKSEDKQNPPRKIYRYLYDGKTVYYVTAPCCDFFTDLYDSNCNLLGHPDGGITGKGDGKLPNFVKLRRNEKLIWKDERQ